MEMCFIGVATVTQLHTCVIKIGYNAVKTVLNGQAKIDKTKVLMTVIKIECNAV